MKQVPLIFSLTQSSFSFRDPAILSAFQFQALLTTNNVTATFLMLCTPSASLDQYLTVPDGVTIDLPSLKTRLCNIDLEVLPQEVMDFLDFDRLMAAVSRGVCLACCVPLFCLGG